jgi:hypothetical protein
MGNRLRGLARMEVERKVGLDGEVEGANGTVVAVAEPPELFRLKCASHRYTADTNSTHFKRNNPLVCRVSARCNHGSTGSKQVYLARRRVYSCTQLINF